MKIKILGKTKTGQDLTAEFKIDEDVVTSLIYNMRDCYCRKSKTLVDIYDILFGHPELIKNISIYVPEEISPHEPPAIDYDHEVSAIDPRSVFGQISFARP